MDKKVGRPIKEINPLIGERIVSLRKDSGLNQNQLADLIGVSRDSIRNWEHSRNEPTKEYAKKLSKVLRCSWNYILCVEDDETVVPKTLADYTTQELLAEIERRCWK